MPIYDQSYRRWDGKLGPLRWLPITTTGIRLALRPRGTALRTMAFYGFLFASQVPFLVLFFANYAYTLTPTFIQENPGMQETLNHLGRFKRVQFPFLVSFTRIFLLVYTIMFGSALIAQDREAKALPLYLSRPLSLVEYLLGKFSVAFFFLGCVTLFPSLILWTFDVLATEQDGYVRSQLPVLGAILLHSGTLVFTYSLTILAASSLCRRPMMAALLWFTLMQVVPLTAVGVAHILNNPSYSAISLFDSLQSIAFDLFRLDELRSLPGAEPIFSETNMVLGIPPLHAWCSVLVYTLLGFLVLSRTLGRQEVTGDLSVR